MSDEPNIREVAVWLRQFIQSFNFHRKGIDKSLGRDCVNAVAWHIAERSADGHGPDGEQWDENQDPEYRREKTEHYGWPDPPPTNYLTGQMLGFVSLVGQPDIQEHEIEMRYGTGKGPEGQCWSPSDNRTQEQKESDDAVTDEQKAMWAQERGRDFYQGDDETEARVIEVAAEALDTYLIEEG